MPLEIDINSTDIHGDTLLLKLCQVHRDFGHKIKQWLTILIKYEASFKAKDNNGIDVMSFLKDNGSDL